MDENVQQEVMQACLALLHRVSQQADARGLTGDALPTVQVSPRPTTKKAALAWLCKSVSEPESTFDQALDALWIVYKRSRPSSQTRAWVVQFLLDLAKREALAVPEAIQIAGTVCAFGLQDSPQQQEAVAILLALAQRRDLFFGDTVEAAHTLYVQSPKGSLARAQGAEMLLAQARWPDITVAQAQEAAQALAFARGRGMQSKAWNLAISVLIELARRPDLSFEEAKILDDQRISVSSTKALVKHQLAAKKQMWESVAQRSDLTSAQRAEVVQALQEYTVLLKQH